MILSEINLDPIVSRHDGCKTKCTHKSELDAIHALLARNEVAKGFAIDTMSRIVAGYSVNNPNSSIDAMQFFMEEIFAWGMAAQKQLGECNALEEIMKGEM